MNKHPIPTAALDDDCLAFLGMRGSGKTYNAGTAVERILARGDRAVIADPLGVWWGLRVLADGKTPSPYKMVIFGGPHGDLPLTENAGALIGETVATMKESAILDLTQLGTEAAATAPRSTAASTGSNGSLPGPQQRIVDALAWWEAAGVSDPTAVQVAVVAKYSPSGGAFRNPLGALNSAGLVCYPTPGKVALTDAGRALANHPGEMPTTEALHARVMEILSGPERKIIAPLLQAYPDAMATDDLAAASGYAPDGGAFRNPLGALRSLKLIDYPAPRQAVALPILFPA